MKKMFEIQDEQYRFPYHHIPHFQKEKVSICRTLTFGFQYLAGLKHILDIVESLKPQSVLDVGCGDGAFLCDLYRRSSMQNVKMTGIDLSQRAISLAKGINPNIDFRVQDISDFKDKYDCIICNQVLEHVPDDGIPDFLAGMANALNLGGSIILSVPTRNLPLTRKHYRHYDLELLQRNLLSCLVELRLERYEFLFGASKLYGAYNRITYNQFFNLRVSALDNAMFRHRLKTIVSTPRRGTDLLAVIKVVR